ncbi:hypothetical protein Gotur_019573 [Gossypium turneri]
MKVFPLFVLGVVDMGITRIFVGFNRILMAIIIRNPNRSHRRGNGSPARGQYGAWMIVDRRKPRKQGRRDGMGMLGIDRDFGYLIMLNFGMCFFMSSSGTVFALSFMQVGNQPGRRRQLWECLHFIANRVEDSESLLSLMICIVSTYNDRIRIGRYFTRNTLTCGIIGEEVRRQRSHTSRSRRVPLNPRGGEVGSSSASMLDCWSSILGVVHMRAISFLDDGDAYDGV